MIKKSIKKVVHEDWQNSGQTIREFSKSKEIRSQNNSRTNRSIFKIKPSCNTNIETFLFHINLLKENQFGLKPDN